MDIVRYAGRPWVERACRDEIEKKRNPGEFLKDAVQRLVGVEHKSITRVWLGLGSREVHRKVAEFLGEPFDAYLERMAADQPAFERARAELEEKRADRKARRASA